MSDFKQISSENKERLMMLVNKVASYVKGGEEPTNALVKAASEHDYPADYILRAAEAYNGAAHLSHFKSAARDERGNSFPLADGYEAVRRVMEKTAAIEENVHQDQFAYLKESSSYFGNVIEDDFLFTEKQAAAPTLDVLMKQASSLENQEKLSVANAQLAYNRACETLAADIEAFREKTAAMTHHRRAYWAKEMLERHGKEALDVISLATGVTGAECEKIAENRLGVYSLGEAYVNELDSIVRSYQQTAMFGEKLAHAECNHFVNKVERDRLLNQAAGFRQKRSGIADGIFNTVKNTLSGEGGEAMGIDKTDIKAIQRDALDAITDPAYFSQINKIDKALLIHKLLKTDDIISKHPARDINQAVSEIYAIAPTAAKYEPLMRAMLRKRLETGEQIDDFSLNQMISMDEKMREGSKELLIAPKLIGGEHDQRSIYG